MKKNHDKRIKCLVDLNAKNPCVFLFLGDAWTTQLKHIGQNGNLPQIGVNSEPEQMFETTTTKYWVCMLISSISHCLDIHLFSLYDFNAS